MKKWTASLLAIGILSLTACSHTKQAEPVVAPAPAAQKYYAASQIAQVLTKTGFACNDFEAIPDSMNGAIDMGSCNAGNIVISIYATQQEAETQPTYLHTLLDGLQAVQMVVGPNWTVNCDLQCQPVEDITHGKYVYIAAE